MNVNPAPLRLGILGVGHFGRFHALKAAANPAIQLIGLHDASFERAAQIAGEVGAPALAPEAVIAAAEAVIIAAPTRFHYALAEQALAAVGMTFALPADIGWNDGASLLITYGTAIHALRDRGQRERQSKQELQVTILLSGVEVRTRQIDVEAS